MKLQSSVLTFAAASSIALSACGSDDKGKTEKESKTSAQAAAELPAVKAGLDRALEQVSSGRRKAAETTVGDTYLEHVEPIEGPLGKVDPELSEQLEEGISTDLRKEIADGASEAALRRHVDRIDKQLDQAKAKLG